MKWYDRILLALSGLVLIALGVVVILGAGGVLSDVIPGMAALDTWLGSGWQWMPLLFLVGALLVVLGLWAFIRAFRRGGEARGKYYTLQSEQDGNVRISVSAIDHLVRKCLSKYEHVASAKVKIGGHEDAMDVTLHMTLTAGVQIPTLVDEIRQDIKQSLQHSAGVTVSTVQVYVDATKDDGDADDMKYLQAAQTHQEPEADPINTTSFYTTPVVVTEEKTPEPELANEPTVAELKKEVDLGPDEPLPVNLSSDAFPFPEEEAGVPLEIYTGDVPITDDGKEDEGDV